MFKPTSAFSGFSVKEITSTKEFYENVLGLEVVKEGYGLRIHLPGGATAFAYPKPNHAPASYTMLDFVVADIDAAVRDLTSRGVVFEDYKMKGQDDKLILRGIANNQGPDIAWFKDPAGNILAVLQES